MLTYLKRKHTLDALKYSHNMHRVGVFGMTVVWGMLARLTWWEYSWDVMEPCTFFVTYGGAILCYSYYLGTKTNPDYDDVSTRVCVCPRAQWDISGTFSTNPVPMGRRKLCSERPWISTINLFFKMSTRWQLERSYTLSKKRNFDIEKFNSLTHEFALVSEQLARLEDELQVRKLRWVALESSHIFFSFYSQKKLYRAKNMR